MSHKVTKKNKDKPKNKDKDRQIQSSSVQLFVCEGKKCKRENTEDLVKKLKKIVKKKHFDQGENRIKITKTACVGACRFGQVAYTGKKSKKSFKGDDPALWKNVHQWSKSQWMDRMKSLVSNV